MNSRDRILAVLNRHPVDRPPVDIWHTPEVVSALKRHFGVGDEYAVWKSLGLDKIVWVFMDYKSASGESTGSQVGAGAESAATRTMWGVPLKGIQSGAAHYEEFGEAPMKDVETAAQVDAYPWWPDPDRFDYDAADRAARRAHREYAVIGPWVSFFEIYCQVRGLEQAMMDLALDPDLVDLILDRIEAIQTDMMKRFFQRTGDALDLVFISDDIAGQTNLLMSPDSWRRHLQPRMARWCKLVHDHGLKVFYHTDGAAEALIGPLIECGIDVLNPIQHVCPGMEPAALKRKYGDRIIFHGGVDNQKVLPFGTPDDVRNEVRLLKRTLGGDGQGFICSSCHNVQAGTPVENILAMVEEARKPVTGDQ
jgi:uroporphyrinogen decarboxylase